MRSIYLLKKLSDTKCPSFLTESTELLPDHCELDFFGGREAPAFSSKSTRLLPDYCKPHFPYENREL